MIVGLVVCILHYFHFKVEKVITGWTGRNFAVYIIYGIILAFFLVLLFKTLSKSNLEIGVWLLVGGLIGFILFTNPDFLFKLGVLELFLVGIVPAIEGKKAKSILPILILLVVAVLVEVSTNLSMKSTFYYFDAWRNALILMSGYVSGCLLV
jgi:hypothetical protein